MERVEGGFKVTATKPFASGAPGGDLLVPSAAYDDPREGAQVLHFPVPLTAEGVSLLDDWQTFAMRATGPGTVKLDGVFVPEAAVALRRPRGAFHPALAGTLPVAMPIVTTVSPAVAAPHAAPARTPPRTPR